MGDRANFGFVQPNGHTIVLYGHWAGANMLANLADAIEKARPRWSDPSYATRIAISQMIAEDWAQELHWGLAVDEILDNEHHIPVVDFQQQIFSLHPEDSFQNANNKVRGMNNEPKFIMDLDTFVNKYGNVVVGV